MYFPALCVPDVSKGARLHLSRPYLFQKRLSTEELQNSGYQPVAQSTPYFEVKTWLTIHLLPQRC